MAATPSGPSTFRLCRVVFLRTLGVVNLIAWVSLWSQLDGLFGSNGIRPIARTVERAGETFGGIAVTKVPTVFWWSASDAFLHAVCGSGTALSLLVILGILIGPSLFLLWLGYLSFVSVGSVFLGYQWDALLLETNLLALAFSPWTPRFRWRDSTEPPRALLWCFRWLLFRLLLLSGLAKLLSGDEAWRNLTALQYHYWTQPLPHPLSWYAHHLPDWVHSLSALGVFAIEIVAASLVLGPRPVRLVAAGAIASLMVLITATGNYGFFTLLTLVLCLTLLDDRVLANLLPGRGQEVTPAPEAARSIRAGAMAIAIVVVGITGSKGALRLGLMENLPAPFDGLVEGVAPLRSFNNYGLFAVMTTERPEILLEGSQDGETWKPYRFHWKPGPTDEPPAFAGFHMPRLDWQMWFAALRGWRRASWLADFEARLLQGSPAVLGLLETNPFPDNPPRFVRMTLYRYRFTSPDEAHRGGKWWTRSQEGPYGPVLERQGNDIRVVPR